MAAPGRKMKNHCRNAAVYAIIIIYLPTYLYLSTCLSVYLSIYLSIYLLYLSIYLSIYIFFGGGCLALFWVTLSCVRLYKQNVCLQYFNQTPSLFFSTQTNKQQYRINSQVLFCIQNFTQRFSSLSEPFHSCRMVFTCGSGLSEMQ